MMKWDEIIRRAENNKRVKWHSLTMVQGKRRILIGIFPSRTRAESTALNLEWANFHPEIIRMEES